MTDQVVRFGILGAGDAGRRHARGLRANKGAALVCAYDTDAARAAAFVKEFGGSVEPDLARFFVRDDVDAIAICTPPADHVKLTLGALASGKHVLVEKPFSLEVLGIDRVIEASRRAGLKVGAISQHRFAEAATTAAALIRDGELGAIVAARISVRRHREPSYYEGSWKGDRAIAGGGTMLSLGVHMLDLACSWLGRPVEAMALLRPAPAGDVEAAAAGAVRFESGALLSIDVATGLGPTQADELEVFGERDRIALVGDKLTRASGFTMEAKADLHAQQIASFVASVRGEAASTVGPEDVRPAIAAIVALYQSAEQRRAIEIPS